MVCVRGERASEVNADQVVIEQHMMRSIPARVGIQQAGSGEGFMQVAVW